MEETTEAQTLKITNNKNWQATKKTTTRFKLTK